MNDQIPSTNRQSTTATFFKLGVHGGIQITDLLEDLELIKIIQVLALSTLANRLHNQCLGGKSGLVYPGSNSSLSG